jgi:heme o synthase
MIRDYWLVTKPGIIGGNLISFTGGFFLASRGHADIALLLPTVIGVSLVIASACVLNNLMDVDLDRIMLRTRKRALARGAISRKAAALYASLLGFAGITILLEKDNLLSVAIVLAGWVIYVLVYTVHLKRNSVHATLIGSLAGAAPPLAGYCAVSGRFDMEAVILLVIFVLWQMPHFYAIAIYRLDDYLAASIPVLPAEQGTSVAKIHIVGYILAFVAATLTLSLAGYTGYIYLSVAAILGLIWLYVAWEGYKAPDDRTWARKVFICSIVIMSALSITMSVDPAMPVSSTVHPVRHLAWNP